MVTLIEKQQLFDLLEQRVRLRKALTEIDSEFDTLYEAWRKQFEDRRNSVQSAVPDPGD